MKWTVAPNRNIQEVLQSLQKIASHLVSLVRGNNESPKSPAGGDSAGGPAQKD